MRGKAARAVFLVGFMGAGKTSVGGALAQRLGWRFLDLDDRIEAREGRSIAAIFHESGEKVFRQAETAALRQVVGELDRGSAVVALGGGAFVQPENGAMLCEAGWPVVFLDAPVEELWRRCAGHGAERPLSRDQNQFRQLYESRRSSYMKADLCVDTSAKSVEAVAEEVASRLGWDVHDSSPR